MILHSWMDGFNPQNPQTLFATNIHICCFSPLASRCPHLSVCFGQKDYFKILIACLILQPVEEKVTCDRRY